MVFELILLAACALAVQGGVIQQQTLAVPAVAGPLVQPHIAAPIASSYRIDRPLQAQLAVSHAAAPAVLANPQFAPAPALSVARATFAAPFAAPIAGPIAAPIAGRIAAPFAAAPFAAAPFAAAPFAAPPYGLAPIAARVAPVATAPLIKTIAAAPVAKTVVAEEYDPNPQYTFSYDVQDALTGDSKGQIESRSGDVVQGSYSVNDPDGTRRTVEYVADPVNGFNAVVHREPQLASKAVIAAAPTIAKVAAPLATPLAYAAPAVAKIAAPVAYSSLAPAPLALSNTLYH